MKWRYVAGFLFCGDKVALIEKLKPAWQKGKLNAIGGKIEEGETPLTAMDREFEEEALAHHISQHDWEQYAIICNFKVGYEVHFFRAFTNTEDGIMSMTEEKVDWYSVNDLPDNVIPNLRWLIPMALDKDLKVPTEIEDIGEN